MSRVATRDTRPEMELRHELHRRGHRYRIDAPPDPSLRGRADILFRPAKVAVYVDGCFWHGCSEHGVLPKSNREWWRAKLLRTAERDRATERTLRDLGWEVVRIWEHEDPIAAADRVEKTLAAGRTARWRSA
jgi:DNA mismatch endonuclease (patch repair protein)